MSLESTLYDAISGDAAVIALVSTRVSHSPAGPNTAVPYITYQLISGTAYNYVQGAPDRERKVFQVNCISKTVENAKAIGEAVKGSLNVSAGYLISEGYDYFPETENHRVRLDFSLIG